MWRVSNKRVLVFAGAGISLLIPSAVFAATTVQTTICAPQSETTITAPTSTQTTTASTVQVVGNATPGKVVTIYKNGVGSGATTVTSGGSYALDTPLDTGTNSIVAKTVNECNTVKQSATISVLRTIATIPPSTTTQPTVADVVEPETPAIIAARPVIIGLAPVVPVIVKTAASDATPTTAFVAPSFIEETDNAFTQIQKEVITKPKPNEVIETDQMWVRGKAQPSSVVAVYINKAIAAQVLSASDGLYGVLVSLQPGQNAVQVKTTAQDGTSTTRIINVKLVSATTKNKPTMAADDTVAVVITACIAVGGFVLSALILSHIPKIRSKVGK